jgi:hypothetical protein
MEKTKGRRSPKEVLQKTKKDQWITAAVRKKVKGKTNHRTATELRHCATFRLLV